MELALEAFSNKSDLSHTSNVDLFIVEKTHLIEISTFWRALICWAVAQRAHNDPSTSRRLSRVTLVNLTSISPAVAILKETDLLQIFD